MSASSLQVTKTSYSEPRSDRAHWAQGWVARHIVADDPYQGDIRPKLSKDERTPLWVSVGLAVMLLSASLSYVGLWMLWRWFVS
jgi:hypothetical protein